LLLEDAPISQLHPQFGPFKKRVVGPPADEIDVNRPFIENLGPFSFLVAIGAGAVKLIGEIALVRIDSLAS
jgi:hypothetical protein